VKCVEQEAGLVQRVVNGTRLVGRGAGPSIKPEGLSSSDMALDSARFTDCVAGVPMWSMKRRRPGRAAT